MVVSTLTSERYRRAVVALRAPEGVSAEWSGSEIESSATTGPMETKTDRHATAS